ncbi:MAG: hypothetical protein FJ318_03045 [SAR202 cluster bacterium]|nr:hypothetical protein [SAR202 cluster bacterium]
METPAHDGALFQPADLNICIFPHLREFLVVDARATVPGGPHTYLLSTEQVLDSNFYQGVERSVSEAIRDTPRTFADLGNMPQRVDDAIRDQALRAILRQIGSEEIVDNEDDDAPEVSVFLCVGAVLSMGAREIESTARAMLGGRAEDPTVNDCRQQFERLLAEERSHAKEEETDQARRAVEGDADFYFTVWTRAAEQP